MEIRLYLSEKEMLRLNRLSKEKNISKSAIIRKLLSAEKYEKTLNQIEINNQLNMEILYQLTQVGNNINQLTRYLHLGLERIDSAEYKINTYINDFKKVLEHNQNIAQSNIIKLDLKQYKTLQSVENE